MAKKFRDKTLASKWVSRVKAARGTRAAALATGRQLLDTLRGVSNTQLDQVLQEKYKEALGFAELYYPVPLTGSYVNSLIPTILRTHPRTLVRPKDASDPIEIGFSNCATALLSSVWVDNQRLQDCRAAVLDSLVYGVGAVVHSWDKYAKRPGARWISARDLLLDPHGSAVPGTMQWMGYERVMPIEVARKEFDKPSLQPNMQSIETDSQVAANPLKGLSVDFDPMAQAALDVAATEDQSAKDRFKVVVIYERAGVPHDESMRISAADFSENEDGGFSGKDRVLVFDAATWELLDERPWGFVLNRGDFPITLVVPTIDPEHSWAYPFLEPVRRLQNLVDMCMSVVANDTKQASRLVNVVNENNCANGAQFLQELADGKQYMNVQTAGAKPEDIFQSKRLFEGDFASLKTLDVAVGMYDNVTNRQGLMSAQNLNYSTATGAEVAQRRTQTSVANPSISVEEFLTQQQIKDLQIAMWLMTGEDVAVLVGSLVGAPTEMDDKGNKVKSYEFWPEDPTIRDIRSVDVWIQPNSTLETSGAERARTIKEIQNSVIEVMSAAKNLGLQADPQKFAEVVPALTLAAVREMQLPDVEQILQRGFKDMFTVAPEALPPEQQPATKGELQQAMQATAQQIMQLVGQQMQQMGMVVQQQGQAIQQLAESVQQIVAAIREQDQSMAAQPMAPTMAPPAAPSMEAPMADPMMAMNSMGGMGPEPGFNGRM